MRCCAAIAHIRKESDPNSQYVVATDIPTPPGESQNRAIPGICALSPFQFQAARAITPIMSTAVEIKSGRLAVNGEMTVYAASALQQALHDAALPEIGPVELDLTEVTEFDTAGVQLILVLRKRAAEANRPFSVIASPNVRDALTLCGLGELLS